MLARTDQPHSPWHLVEADSKRYARVKVVETVIDRIEAGMRVWGMEPRSRSTMGAERAAGGDLRRRTAVSRSDDLGAQRTGRYLSSSHRVTWIL
jgi:hypothetical protein